MDRTFEKNDEGFICRNCGKKVEPLHYTSRDHCPYCLTSIHIDIYPGDRKNPCLGTLKPIGIEKFKDTFKILYRCDKCSELKKNIMAQDDDMAMIIKVSSGENLP